MIAGVAVNRLAGRRSSARGLGRRQYHTACGPVVFAIVADDCGCAGVFVARGWSCRDWRYSQTRPGRSEVVCILSGDFCDLGCDWHHARQHDSARASESIRLLRLPYSNATLLMLQKPSRLRTQTTTTFQAADAGGGNDSSKESVFCDLGQRRSEHASPHVLCSCDWHRNHAASRDQSRRRFCECSKVFIRSRPRSSR